jgi:hypothetical protein
MLGLASLDRLGLASLDRLGLASLDPTYDVGDQR